MVILIGKIELLILYQKYLIKNTQELESKNKKGSNIKPLPFSLLIM